MISRDSFESCNRKKVVKSANNLIDTLHDAYIEDPITIYKYLENQSKHIIQVCETQCGFKINNNEIKDIINNINDNTEEISILKDYLRKVEIYKMAMEVYKLE